MAAKKRRSKKRKESEYAFLAIAVDNYEARTEAGLNLSLLGSSRYFIDDEPVYSFDTDLDISGVCTYPDERAGDRYEISLRASTTTPRSLRLKIKELQKRDKDGFHVFRKYKDGSYPVYDEPSPVAYLEKVRGEPRWTVWVQVAPQMVSDSLAMLSGSKSVYVSLHERKEDRKRKVQSLTVQTTDPAEE